MYTDYIGLTSTKVKNVVERELVRRFADSIGDNHPIYIDEKRGNNLGLVPILHLLPSLEF